MSITTREVTDGPSATRGQGHIITSADKLVASWDERDYRYSQRLTPLTDEEVKAIRVQREREAGYVEPRRRGPLFSRARHWRPPSLGEWS